MLDLALLLGRGLWRLPKVWGLVCNHCGKHLTFAVVLVMQDLVWGHCREHLTLDRILLMQDLVRNHCGERGTFVEETRLCQK